MTTSDKLAALGAAIGWLPPLLLLGIAGKQAGIPWVFSLCCFVGGNALLLWAEQNAKRLDQPHR
jgi:hypothetical protein